jgi:hypothetical protein
MLLLLSFAILLENGSKNSGWLLRGKPQHSVLVEAMDPITDNSHMNVVKHKYSTVYFTICICYCRYAYGGVLTTHHVTPVLVGNAETIILVIARGANHSIVRWLRLWIHPRLLPYQCQTHVKCISPSSYVVDVHMDVSWASLPLLTRPCFWKIARILVISWGANHIIVGWLRLWTHSRWLPHQCKTYVKCVTHFICCGCACGFVLTALPLCSCWPSCSWKTARPTRLLVIPRGKPQHSGLVEAMDPIPDYSHINVKHM